MAKVHVFIVLKLMTSSDSSAIENYPNRKMNSKKKWGGPWGGPWKGSGGGPWKEYKRWSMDWG